MVGFLLMVPDQSLPYSRLTTFVNLPMVLIHQCLRAWVLFPIHPRTFKKIKEFRLEEKLEQNKNIILSKPYGYLKLLRAMDLAKLVITDSGGIQKEAFILEKPTITLRKTTEWIETLIENRNTLFKDDFATLALKINEIIEINLPKLKDNPFGKGNASKIITNDLIARKESKILGSTFKKFNKQII